MDSIHLFLDGWARDISKLGPEYVFGHRCFHEAAERYTVDEIVDLFVRLREAVPMMEDSWREKFLQVFTRGRGAIPPFDWERFRWGYGPGVFGAIDEDNPDELRAWDTRFRNCGFRLPQLRFTHEEFRDICRLYRLDLAEVEPGQDAPQVCEPAFFAECRGRTRMLELLRELGGQE